MLPKIHCIRRAAASSNSLLHTAPLHSPAVLAMAFNKRTNETEQALATANWFPPRRQATFALSASEGKCSSPVAMRPLVKPQVEEPNKRAKVSPLVVFLGGLGACMYMYFVYSVSRASLYVLLLASQHTHARTLCQAARGRSAPITGMSSYGSSRRPRYLAVLTPDPYLSFCTLSSSLFFAIRTVACITSLPRSVPLVLPVEDRGRRRVGCVRAPERRGSEHVS